MTRILNERVRKANQCVIAVAVLLCAVSSPGFALRVSAQESPETAENSKQAEYRGAKTSVDNFVRTLENEGKAFGNELKEGFQTIRDKLREEYFYLRKEFITSEQALRWKGLSLSADELKVEKLFSKVRSDYVAQYQGDNSGNQANFPPALPFCLVKEEIERSESFHLIRSMPKGGLLHVHSSVCGSARWIVDHMGDYEHCYVYWPMNDSVKSDGYIKGQLIFSKNDIPAGFVAPNSLSRRDRDEMVSLLMMDSADFASQDSRDPWVQFGKTFQRIGAFTSQLPVFRDYFEAALRSCVEDGIDYVEIRCGLTQLSDVRSDTKPGKLQFVEEFRSIRGRIQSDHPAFDLNLIITGGRVSEKNLQATNLAEEAQRVFELHTEMPDMIIGYDLVGKETMDNQTRNVLDVWLTLKEHASRAGIARDLPFYFHDGETDWADNPDVIDAFLLGSRRIGHGFNLVAYPRVESELIHKGVAVEVCPISNQALRYIGDLRIHPACGYIRRGVPCVLGNDDPLIFGNHGLSFDFWEAWMAWDLKLSDLKLLALNSISYSGMERDEKKAALAHLQDRWNVFIAQTIKQHNL
jgi:adenosine deaminase CECR1